MLFTRPPRCPESGGLAQSSHYIKDEGAQPRCIKDEEGKVLTENDEIRKRWQRFFANLLNGEGVREDGSWGGDCSDQRAGDYIAKEKIREALKKMANGKAVGPDQIPVEV